LVGIAQGGVAAPASPTPNLTIVIPETIAYDQLGQRIFTTGDTIDCSKDSNNVSTAVSGAGNEKYVSVFILFERSLSDPQIDGNGMTVYYVQAESYQYEVVQGAEATIGTATTPALVNPGLLLADIHLIHLQSQIQSTDINNVANSPVRVQFTFVIDQTPFSVVAGTVPAAIAAMLTDLNAHVNSIGTAHPATAISAAAFTGTRFSMSAEDLQLQITAMSTQIDNLRSIAGVPKNGIVAMGSVPYSSNFSTTSGTYVDVTSFSGTLAVVAGDVLLLSLNAYIGVESLIGTLAITTVDGATTTNLLPTITVDNSTSSFEAGTFSTSAIYTVMNTGTLTYKVQAKQTGGTFTVSGAVQPSGLTVIQFRP
jgi:hypothetical protein